MAVELRDIELWFIRNTEDPSFHSIPFRSEAEAQKTIDETDLFTSHIPFSTIFPVKYDEKTVYSRARAWVAENLEGTSLSGWTKDDYWEYIEEFHVGGKNGFLVLSPLGQTSSIR